MRNVRDYDNQIIAEEAHVVYVKETQNPNSVTVHSTDAAEDSRRAASCLKAAKVCFRCARRSVQEWRTNEDLR